MKINAMISALSLMMLCCAPSFANEMKASDVMHRQDVGIALVNVTDQGTHPSVYRDARCKNLQKGNVTMDSAVLQNWPGFDNLGQGTVALDSSF